MFKLTTSKAVGSLIALLTFVLVAAVVPSSVSAAHCYVADKPAEAGTHITVVIDAATEEAVSIDGVETAGNSDNLHITGAFAEVWLDLTGDGDGDLLLIESTFVRGPEELNELIQGIGSLPEPPHVNGSPDHGVQTVEE